MHRQTHDKTSFLNVTRKASVLREKAVARMDHLGAVLHSDLNDLVTSEVSSNGRVLAALANHVRLVGLLPMHAKSILITEDSDGVQGELVGGSEDTNSYI